MSLKLARSYFLRIGSEKSPCFPFVTKLYDPLTRKEFKLCVMEFQNVAFFPFPFRSTFTLILLSSNLSMASGKFECGVLAFRKFHSFE